MLVWLYESMPESKKKVVFICRQCVLLSGNRMAVEYGKIYPYPTQVAVELTSKKTWFGRIRQEDEKLLVLETDNLGMTTINKEEIINVRVFVVK